MIKHWGLGALLLSLASCGTAGDGEGQLGESRAALLARTPNLAAGQLCSTRGFVGAAPAISAGIATFSHPQSRGVLGGTGVGPSGVVAQTRIDFSPTQLSQSIAHGPAQRVCAEVGARSACEGVYACWYGDGRYTLESNSSARCDPTAEHATTVLQTGSSTLPALSVGGTFAIELSVNRAASDTLTANFYQSGALVQSLSRQTPFDRDLSRQGLAGFRADRVALTLQAKGTASFTSPAVSGAWVSSSSVQGVATRPSPSSEAAHCSFQAPPPTDLSSALYEAVVDSTRRGVGVAWQAPDGAGSTSLTYEGFLDGRAVSANGLQIDADRFFSQSAKRTSAVFEVPGSNYLYQVAYEDGGALSEIAPYYTHTAPAPITPMADSALSVGVVLLTYADGPSVPFTREQITAKIFGESGYTLKGYLRDVARGQVQISGQVSPWITVRRLSGANTGQALPFAIDCPGVATSGTLAGYAGMCNMDAAATPCQDPQACNLPAQAVAGGFPVSGYERVIYLINGQSNAASKPGFVMMGAASPYVSDPDGTSALDTLVHEFGHSLSFGHSYTSICPRADLNSFADDACTLPGGSRASNGVPLRFDGMVPASNVYRFHSEHQRILGWLQASEQAVHLTGQANQDYTLSPLGANGGLHQLRIEVEPNAFYFAEYRTREGFDAPGPFPPRDIEGDGNLDRNVYDDPTGVAIWLSGGTTEPTNSYRIHAVASRMGSGDVFCDPYRKVALRVTSLGSGVAGVRVERGNVPCQLKAVSDQCQRSDECSSNLCSSGICWTPGTTAPFSVPLGGACSLDAACASGACAAGICRIPNGAACSQNPECSSGFCDSGACRPAHCGNLVKDADETDLDCGGSCHACSSGQSCSAATDCSSGFCGDSVCLLKPSAIDSGQGFTCARFSDNKLRCWGRNEAGQLGIPASLPLGDAPGEVGPNLQAVNLAGPVLQFALGWSHACAVLTNGSVQCWGANGNGQLGAGDVVSRHQPVTIDLGGNASQVALGYNFSCARMVNAKVKCWGQNNLGQLGVGHKQDIGDQPGEMGTNLQTINLPVALRQISAGGNHACALSSAGSEVRCWGFGLSGQLGVDAGVAYGDESTELGMPLPVNFGSGFIPTEVAAGGDHTCARSLHGLVKCWGNNAWGQLGYGDTQQRGRNPALMGDNLPVVPIGPILKIDARVHSSCAMTVSGEIRCWGAGTAAGQPALVAMNNLGDQPGEVAGLPPIDLGPTFAGAFFTTNGFSGCAVATSGIVKCWGLNTSGELGLGDTATRGDDLSDMGVNLPRVPLP